MAGLRGPFLTSPPEPGQIADFAGAEPSGCLVQSIVGAKLMVESPRSFTLGIPVKVTSRNRMWMGEVWACEPAAGGFLVEIDVDAALNDVRSVDDLAARFRHERVIRNDGDGGEGKR